ncbi:hypothetical protein DVH24_027281 [Malus domestica]|uniref:Uncharacterized protein n=1 Tax=Malus domestica TaxID=3750 RepID=A0A498IR52_MALDO|nr:hypothetical protein DVH24_027281 [Malus domestica]
MEGEPCDVVPCSSASERRGRLERLEFSMHWVEGLVAGICTLTHCGLQRYRGKSDWVNGLVAGVVAGGAIAAMTRSWTQMFLLINT